MENSVLRSLLCNNTAYYYCKLVDIMFVLSVLFIVVILYFNVIFASIKMLNNKQCAK